MRENDSILYKSLELMTFSCNPRAKPNIKDRIQEPPPVPPPWDPFSRAFRHGAVKGVFSQLPDRLRLIVVHFYIPKGLWR